MGSAWYIVAHEPEVLEGVVVNGKAFGRHFDHLGVLAEENGLPRPEAYCSQSKEEALSFLCGQLGLRPEDIPASSIAEETWHPPQEGLDYVNALAELVRSGSSMAATVRQAVLEDLEEYQVALGRLVGHECTWHFAVDV